MNWLINLYWDVRFKIEDTISDWKWNRELNKEYTPFVGEEYVTELDQAEGTAGAWEEKPKKKKKAKKKSVKKAKKSI